MYKLLIDDLGRCVGAAECKRGASEIVEYGTRDNDGALRTAGRARLTNASVCGMRIEDEQYVDKPEADGAGTLIVTALAQHVWERDSEAPMRVWEY